MDSTNKGLRLQAYLARCGVASRRASESLITGGRIKINGTVQTVLGTKVFPGDEVQFDEKIVHPESTLRYIMLHKPSGYICSSSDPQGRPLAKDLLPVFVTERVYTIGRLDFLSSGLILFTNDGAFASRIGHPSAELEKEYHVDSTVPIPDAMMEAFRNGIEIDGIVYRCKSIDRTGRKSVRITLVEGKNREIRRVFSHFHLHAEKLHRVRIGPVQLGLLKEAESRSLSEFELKQLTKAVSGV